MRFENNPQLSENFAARNENDCIYMCLASRLNRFGFPAALLGLIVFFCMSPINSSYANKRSIQNDSCEVIWQLYNESTAQKTVLAGNIFRFQTEKLGEVQIPSDLIQYEKIRVVSGHPRSQKLIDWGFVVGSAERGFCINSNSSRVDPSKCAITVFRQRQMNKSYTTLIAIDNIEECEFDDG